jgi:hypothetical protein
MQGDLRNLPDAIAPLTKLPYWVLWRWERPKKDSNKWTKVPYQPSGAKAKNNDRDVESLRRRDRRGR